jgi:hypothetical protein
MKKVAQIRGSSPGSTAGLHDQISFPGKQLPELVCSTAYSRTTNAVRSSFHYGTDHDVFGPLL